MSEPIAVIGLACLFPGAKTPEEFWQNLLAGADSRSEATARQMHTDPAWFRAEGKGVTDRYYCTQGGYIHDFAFDPEGFRIPAERLAGLDDVFQWPLHVAREALRDAGVLDNTDRLRECGVWINYGFLRILPLRQAKYLKFSPARFARRHAAA